MKPAAVVDWWDERPLNLRSAGCCNANAHKQSRRVRDSSRCSEGPSSRSSSVAFRRSDSHPPCLPLIRYKERKEEGTSEPGYVGRDKSVRLDGTDVGQGFQGWRWKAVTADWRLVALPSRSDQIRGSKGNRANRKSGFVHLKANLTDSIAKTFWLGGHFLPDFEKGYWNKDCYWEFWRE